MRFTILASAAVLLAAAQDPHQKLKEVLKDQNAHESWIYNDLARGTAEAKKSGKPLLVVFR